MIGKNRFAVIATLGIGLLAQSSAANAFGLSFSSWGNIPSCTSGNPKTVSSPAFSLSGVPNGTVKLKFSMRDLNVTYNHGGGTVQYGGGSSVPSGAFKYKSPCPPNGSHNYQWTVTALDAKGKTLGKATAKKRYP